jgi:hypothetical protein
VKAVFLQVLHDVDKATAILSAIATPPGSLNRRHFEFEPRALSAVPRSPFAYWVSDRLRQTFAEFRTFESNGRSVKQGLSTADDLRFVRVWWAILGRKIGSHWYPFAKGGRFSPYYADSPAVLNWASAGHELRAFASAAIRNPDFYFLPGLTWPLRGIRYSAQTVPAGHVFSVAGKMAFAAAPELPQLAALFNSLPFDQFLAFFAGKVGGVQYEVGLIQSVPLPDPSPVDGAALAAFARRAWSLKRGLDSRTEVSHAFILPALIQVDGQTLIYRAEKWSEHVQGVQADVATIQAEIDERCYVLYGIGNEDRRAITEGFGAGTDGSEMEELGSAEDAENEDEAEAGADTVALAAELVSWTVGVAFGRFDVRLATGERPLPSEPAPFDPLPVCSAGMLTGEDGLPLPRPPAGYPLSFPEDGVLVDDPGHPRDLTAFVRAVFDAVFGSRADAMWQEASALLDPRDRDLRRWLASEFFEHHLRRYSKSRRKAPILWQLGIPSGRYSVWCYAHHMTRDSLLAIQNDVVGPKLATEERRLSSLVQTGETPSARERAEIATQESLVDELRTLTEEVRRVAALWNPDLDDGIVLVLAPVWRLVPTHKAWQKELRSKWEELVAGKYDWAHVAMHLWPERVVAKCATDRSLAVAHGLEDVLWVEGTDGKWSARKNPTRPIAELVAERTSPAVKAALAALLEAQQPLGAAKRRGRSSKEAI